MYYITNHEDKILNDLAKLEKEFDRVDKMIADLYTLIGVHANGHYVLLTKQEAAEEVDVSVRQFERLIYDWHLDKVETPHRRHPLPPLAGAGDKDRTRWTRPSGTPQNHHAPQSQGRQAVPELVQEVVNYAGLTENA